MNPARLVILLALMVSIGGQWLVLQGVAWVGMAVAYSIEEGSVTSGLGKTFDGDHPCPLCKAVRKASQEDGDPAAPFAGKGLAKSKTELCADSRLQLFPPAGLLVPVEWQRKKAPARTSAPDAPPPRSLAV
jgi:hypothetical protein